MMYLLLQVEAARQKHQPAAWQLQHTTIALQAVVMTLLTLLLASIDAVLGGRVAMALLTLAAGAPLVLLWSGALPQMSTTGEPGTC